MPVTLLLTAENFRRDLTVEPITSVFGSDRRSVTGGGQLRSHLKSTSRREHVKLDKRNSAEIGADVDEEHQPPRTR